MNEKSGDKLRLARLTKKMTLKDLAEKCNLSYSYISQVERGDASPSLSSLSRLAKALDVSPRTVSTHLSNIFKELGIESRGELADFVKERGLLA